jgi:arginine decarboxylase
LIAKLRKQVEIAVREKKVTLEEGTQLMKYYEEGMLGYTYLEEPSA